MVRLDGVELNRKNKPTAVKPTAKFWHNAARVTTVLTTEGFEVLYLDYNSTIFELIGQTAEIVDGKLPEVSQKTPAKPYEIEAIKKNKQLSFQ